MSILQGFEMVNPAAPAGKSICDLREAVPGAVNNGYLRNLGVCAPWD